MAGKQKKICEIGEMISVRKDHRFAYNIYPKTSFDDLADVFESELDSRSRRAVIVTDSHVEKLYLSEVKKCLEGVTAELSVFVIEAGEENKNLDHIRQLYVHLIGHSLDRHDILVALGGGVIGDMTGFAAATYLRGIRFVQIPTTLLAQVDSSIGGKTGVDFDGYKNMVGAFHQPSLVYINISTLNTLDDEQFASGMGEVLKHGLIRDAAYYEWCLDHMGEIQARERDVLLEMVVRSIEIKRVIVERDVHERGDRALLNFGHTAGHAIEKLRNFELSHGACVALGSIVSSYISWKRGYIGEEIFYEIRDMFVGFDLPISFDSLEVEDILETMKKDKKMDRGTIRFVLLKKLGDACIDETVTDDELREALSFVSFDADSVAAGPIISSFGSGELE